MGRSHTTPDGNIPFTSEEETEKDAEEKLAEENFTKFGYIDKRKTEYPDYGEQLDEIYHNGIDSWKAIIKVTKDKYPKG